MKDKKLTQVDKTIIEMMKNFPSLFPSRVECWIHLFSGYGTGYEWNLDNGRLEYFGEYSHAIGPDLEEIKEEDNEYAVFWKKRENLLRQYSWDNIEIAATDYHHSAIKRNVLDMHISSWQEENEEYYYSGPMQDACKNKDKISKEWRYEVSYFCDWIISETRKMIYDPSEDGIKTNDEIIELLSSCKIRKMNELLTSFTCAVKVLENIFTEEEVEWHKEAKKRMNKMVDKILKDMETLPVKEKL